MATFNQWWPQGYVLVVSCLVVLDQWFLRRAAKQMTDLCGGHAQRAFTGQ